MDIKDFDPNGFKIEFRNNKGEVTQTFGAENDASVPKIEKKKCEMSSSWVSVLDRLPERGVTVMVFSQDGEIYFDAIDDDCDDGDRWYAHDQSYEHYCNVAKPSGSMGPDCEAPYTHWMPLPEPPTE